MDNNRFKRVIRITVLSMAFLFVANTGPVGANALTDLPTGGLDESVPAIRIQEYSKSGRLRAKFELPSKYDSRTKGYVTPVRNQDGLDTCWSFATIAAIESSVLAQRQANSSANLDLSERQLAYFSFNLEPDQLGNTLGDKNKPTNSETLKNGQKRNNYILNWGNAWLTTQAMASGIGVVDESKAPTQFLIDEWKNSEKYYTETFQNKTRLSPNLARGSNSWRLSSAKRISMRQRDAIKQAVMEYGGVAVLTHFDTADSNTIPERRKCEISWGESAHAYYNHGEGKSNHMVTIVGWDDSFSKENFNDRLYYSTRRTPNNDGAWLCKNSAGDKFGDNGFYWLSYEDYYFNKTDPQNLEKGSVAAYAYDMRPASEKEILYQYDGAAGTCYKTIPSDGSIANMFTVSGADGKDQLLESVCLTLLNDAEVNYSIQIYTDCTDASVPTSGTPVLSTEQNGRTTYAGFYTIPLDEKILLKPGSRFAVVVTLSHDDKSQDVNYDVDSTGPYHKIIEYESKVAPNNSFVRNTADSSWTDLYTRTCDCDRNKDKGHIDQGYPDNVARIKAITTYESNDESSSNGTNSQGANAGNDTNHKAQDGTAVGRGASQSVAENAIMTSTSEEGPAGTRFAPLMLRSVKQGKSSIILKWNAVSGAKKYIVFGNTCGKTKRMQKLATLTGKTYKVKRINKTLKKGTYHKFIVLALDENGNVVTTSKVVHVATKGGKKAGNPSKVTVKRIKRLKAGKTHKLAAKQKGKRVKNHRKIAYETSNETIATVNKKGVIKAVHNGTCYVYAYAQNGLYKKVKIVVK